MVNNKNNKVSTGYYRGFVIRKVKEREIIVLPADAYDHVLATFNRKVLDRSRKNIFSDSLAAKKFINTCHKQINNI